MSKIRINRQEQVCPATGESFIPNRDNQVYKNRAVQIKNNNDRTKEKNKLLKLLNDKIKANDKKLAKLFIHMIESGFDRIAAEHLDYEKIDFRAYTDTAKNKKTNGKVFWCLEYGFEAADEDLNFYYIHKKTTK